MRRGKVKSGLTAKGFQSIEGSNHEKFIYHDASGKKRRIMTVLSRGPSGRDVDSKMIHAMARQCQLTAPQFNDLIDCTLSRADYEKVVGL